MFHQCWKARDLSPIGIPSHHWPENGFPWLVTVPSPSSIYAISEWVARAIMLIRMFVVIRNHNQHLKMRGNPLFLASDDKCFYHHWKVRELYTAEETHYFWPATCVSIYLIKAWNTECQHVLNTCIEYMSVICVSLMITRYALASSPAPVLPSPVIMKEL